MLFSFHLSSIFSPPLPSSLLPHPYPSSHPIPIIPLPPHLSSCPTTPLPSSPLTFPTTSANLTWRDVQHIIILASNPSFPSDPQWHKNGLGRLVSHKFGYGVLDGAVLVNRARHWITVPPQVNCTVDAVLNNRCVCQDGEKGNGCISH